VAAGWRLWLERNRDGRGIEKEEGMAIELEVSDVNGEEIKEIVGVSEGEYFDE
jgi:hypothetical protein